jgi:hypothetical protein
MLPIISPPSQETASFGEVFRQLRGGEIDVCCIFVGTCGRRTNVHGPEYFTTYLRWPVK